MEKKNPFDALFFVSFGGPEGKPDVMPFLNNVLKGKPVSEERKLEVAEHYYKYEGISPINAQNRELIAAMEKELVHRQIDLPIYFGNRNWHPMIEDGFKRMIADEKKNVLCFFTSAYSSFSGCRQYRNNLADTQEKLQNEKFPQYSLIRKFYNHPKFIACHQQRFLEAEKQSSILCKSEETRVLFTAHSIPTAMAQGCDYQKQLMETCELVAKSCGIKNWKLVYQSRSGSPRVPWLEPDVCAAIETAKEEGFKNVMVSPIGFISDHMEVMYDLDVEAKDKAEELNLGFVRVLSPGTHPKFVEMIVDLIEERLDASKERMAIGQYPARADQCPENCCQWTRPQRPQVQR